MIVPVSSIATNRPQAVRMYREHGSAVWYRACGKRATLFFRAGTRMQERTVPAKYRDGAVQIAHCPDCGSELSDMGAHGIGCETCGEKEMDALDAAGTQRAQG